MKVVFLGLLALLWGQILCQTLRSDDGLSQTGHAQGDIIDASRYADIQQAMKACQTIANQSSTAEGTKGCIVAATSSKVNTALGVLDPGDNTVPITLVLGPLAFTASQIILRSDFKLLGAGLNHTTITSVGTNLQNLIVFPRTDNNDVTGVSIHNIRFHGFAANTSQEGLSIDVSGLKGSQLGQSDFVNLQFDNFGGPGIHFKGTPNDASSAIQFLNLNNVQVFQPGNSRAPALVMEGYNGQISFEDTLFNVTTPGTNDAIYLGPTHSTGTYVPVSIYFHNVSVQGGSNGIHFGGVENITIDGDFSEASRIPFAVSADSSELGLASNTNITITHSYIAGTSAWGAVISDSDSNSAVHFKDNLVFGKPGAFISGLNANQVDYCDNVGWKGVAGCLTNSRFTSTGLVEAQTLTVGGGSTISKILRKVGVALNSPLTSIAAGTCQTKTLTLPGAATTGVAQVSPTAFLGTGIFIGYSWVSRENTVSVNICSSTAAIPLAVKYNVQVLQ